MEKQENGATGKARMAAFLKKRGLYVILLLCFAAAGVALALSMNGETTAEEQAGEQTEEAQAETVRIPLPEQAQVVDPEAVLDLQQLLPEEEVQAVSAPVAAEPEKKRAPVKAAPPVDGEILWEYADSYLIYSETLEQWTTHEGVDIAADPGAEVRSVLAGEVESVETDDVLGVTVVIRHTGEQESVYANLREKPPVQPGDPVNAGDVVGYVGDTARAECGMDSHLHFGFRVGGESRDPGEFVLFVP